MTDDATLAGYLKRHARPPAFEGSDGHAYSVGVYADHTDSETGAFGAALLFIRWSKGGDRPIGHVETEWMAYGETEQEARRHVLALTMEEIKAALERTLSETSTEDVMP